VASRLKGNPLPERPTATSLTDAAAAWLPRLGQGSLASGFYLAGSAALAVSLGGRRVGRLDLMSPDNRLAPTERRDLLVALLAVDPAARVGTARDGFLLIHTGNGAVLQFFFYPYPLVDPPAEIAGLEVAALADLALMKVGAVISRGTRRDFVDLYSLARRLPLASVLARAAEKFPHVRDFELQALKALVDWSEVEDRSPPWPETEAFFLDETRRLARARFEQADG